MYDTLVSWEALKIFHPATDIFAKGAERKLCRSVEEETCSGAVTVFQDYGRPLIMVSLFKYFSGVFSTPDDQCTTVVYNMSEAWRKWDIKYIILGREVLDAFTSFIFYKYFIQANLLFGSETWVVNP